MFDGPLSTLEAAEAVRRHGRAGDSILVHVNPEEFEQMQEIWGEPSVNPHTGLPEYGWWSKVKKKVKKAVKNIGKSIKKSAMPWTITKQDIEDIKHGKGIAAFGTPLHGLTAGYGISRWASGGGDTLIPEVTMFQNAKDLITGKKSFKDQFYNFRQVANDAWDEGKYPLMFAAGNWLGNLGGTGSAGAASAAEGAGTLASGASGAASAIPAGIEGVTVTASTLPDWMAAIEAGTALAPIAAATNAPASEPAPEAAPEQEPGFLDKTWDYVKNPDNWEDIAGGALALASLYDQYNMPEPEGPPQMDPGEPLDIRYDPRRFLNPMLDYYSYGMGPEAQFYEYPVVQSARGGRIRRPRSRYSGPLANI